jgi:hypothetical protein
MQIDVIEDMRHRFVLILARTRTAQLSEKKGHAISNVRI